MFNLHHLQTTHSFERNNYEKCFDDVNEILKQLKEKILHLLISKKAKYIANNFKQYQPLGPDQI